MFKQIVHYSRMKWQDISAQGRHKKRFEYIKIEDTHLVNTNYQKIKMNDIHHFLVILVSLHQQILLYV